MATKFVLLIGAHGSGKDYIANRIVTRFYNRAATTSFTAEARRYLSSLLTVDYAAHNKIHLLKHEMDYNAFKSSPMTQTVKLGTVGGHVTFEHTYTTAREWIIARLEQAKDFFGPDVWAKKMLQVLAETNVKPLTFITDFRFQEELETLQASHLTRDLCIVYIRRVGAQFSTAVDEKLSASIALHCDAGADSWALNNEPITYKGIPVHVINNDARLEESITNLMTTLSVENGQDPANRGSM